MAAASGGGGSSGAIRAGRAYVSIGADDAGIVAALSRLKKRFTALNSQLRAMSIGAGAIGAGILTPLLALTRGAINAGSAFKDMSERLGGTTEELSAMAYGLELGGGSVEDLETGLKKMQQHLAASGGGGGSLTEQIGAFANEIAAMKDPAKQTARAIEIFGRGGLKLLPFLKQGSAGMKALMDQAARDGGVFSAEQTDAADRAGDVLSRVYTVIKSIGREVGMSLLPASDAAEEFAENFAGFGAGVRDFVARNAGIIKIVAGVGAGLMALSVAGLAASGMFSGLMVVVTAIGTLLSPAGLIVAGVAALSAGLVIAARDSTTLGDSFGTTFEGIKDALSGGDLELAARIGFAGLSVEWTKVINEMTAEWRNFQDLLSMDPKKSKTVGTAGFAASTLLNPATAARSGIFQSIWEDFQLSLGRNVTMTGNDTLRGALDELNANDRGINADREKRDQDLRDDLQKKKDELDALRNRARRGFGDGGDWGDDTAITAAVAAVMGSSTVKSIMGNNLAGASLNIGDQRSVAEDIRKSRIANESTEKILKNAPPLVWGD